VKPVTFKKKKLSIVSHLEKLCAPEECLKQAKIKVSNKNNKIRGELIRKYENHYMFLLQSEIWVEKV
jgi:hypothetical protein